MCGQKIERQSALGHRQSGLPFGEDDSHARGQTSVKWGVSPAELPWPMHCTHQCSCCQLSGVAGGGGAACVDRKERACVCVCLGGGKGWGFVGAWRHMVLLPEQKGSFPCNTCRVSHKQVTCLTSQCSAYIWSPDNGNLQFRIKLEIK